MNYWRISAILPGGDVTLGWALTQTEAIAEAFRLGNEKGIQPVTIEEILVRGEA